MANFTTDYSTGRKASPLAYDACAFPLYFDYAMPDALARAAGDTIELGPLPIGVQPIDITETHEAIAASAGTFSIGLLNTGKTDLDTSAANGGAVWLGATPISAIAVGVNRATTVAINKTVPSTTVARSVAIKVGTAFTTSVLGARIWVTVWCINA